MNNVLTFIILLLGTVFICSFVVLVILCRYKNLRKKTAFYVKKLARAELSHSDIELIEKTEIKRSWKILTTDKEKSTFKLESRCKALLDLCDSLDLSSKEITSTDLNKLHYIIQVARTITEESNLSSANREKSGLLECHTTNLLLQVSRTMARMEQQLKTAKEFSVQDTAPDCQTILAI